MEHYEKVYAVLKSFNRPATTAEVQIECLTRFSPGEGVGNADKYLRMGRQTESSRERVNPFPGGLPYFGCRKIDGKRVKEWWILKPLPIKKSFEEFTQTCYDRKRGETRMIVQLNLI